MLILGNQLGLDGPQTATTEHKLHTAKDVAKYLGVTPETIRRWQTADEFFPKRHMLNDELYWLEEDIDKFVRRAFLMIDFSK